MNGPPLVIYGTMRRWSAQHFRATLQGYFLPASIIGMAGYWLDGLWTPAVTHYYLLSLPVTLLGIFLGRVVNHRMHGEAFLKYIYVGLAGTGVLLFIQAIRQASCEYSPLPVHRRLQRRRKNSRLQAATWKSGASSAAP